MLRLYSLFLLILLLLSGCSISGRDPVATGPTARPTAYTLPTPSVTSAVPPAAATVTVDPTLVPTEVVPPTPVSVVTVVPTSAPAESPVPTGVIVPTSEAATPTQEDVAPTQEMPTDAPTQIPATATPEPLPPTPSATEASDHIITVDEPVPGALLTSPFMVRGSTNFWPFEATLGGVLKDGAGNVLVRFPVMVQSPDVGQPGPFSEEVSFAEPATEQQGTLEIFEESPENGSIVTFISILVRLGAPAIPETSLQIEYPAEGADVITPLHVAFGGAASNEHLVLRLTQADGTVLAQDVRASQGYVVTTMLGSVVPGLATLDIVRDDGSILGRRGLHVVPLAETQTVNVAWLKPGSEEIVLVERRIPRTVQIASAALSEMLWGPNPGEAFATGVPAPDEILASGVRTAEWGSRVRLLKLTISDGVALANLSSELKAYGGGSARVGLIRKQIETTLRQFPSVKDVVIAIDGETEGILQP